MSHKVVTKDAVENLKSTVAYLDSQIDAARSYSSGSKDSLDAAMKVAKEWEFDAGYKKDQLLRTGSDQDANMARRWQGKQEAYQDIITLFEEPSTIINRYVEERNVVQNQLDQLKHLEQR